LRVKRILFVEDEPNIQDPMSHALRSGGYSVDVAGTAAEAKSCLIAQTYDLVIVDWRLPDGDGRVIADWAAELGAKTIVVSGYLHHMPSGRAEGHETIMKPFWPRDLVAAVQRCLSEVAEIGKPVPSPCK
jgi:DNA-binding response OmpR family regulator